MTPHSTAKSRFHLLLLSLTLVVLVVAVLMAAADVAIGWCLLVVMLAPWVSVVGYETIGHRHMAAALDALDGRVRSPN